ncbi:MAG: arylsulfatase [Armatimonadaceae bacterium]
MNTIDLPNIVYILADDLGYGDVSCLNPESKIQTPHLDRMASEGMVFTDAHSNSAVCTPTRYGILTGRYAWRTRLQRGVLFGFDRPLIEPERLTVPQLLKEKGYHTGCVGKWHLGLGWIRKDGLPIVQDVTIHDPGVDYTVPLTVSPNDFGFDYYFGISASLDMAPYVYIENHRLTEQPDHETEGKPFPENWRRGPTAPDFRQEEVLTRLTEKAIGYIEERACETPRQPFFLYFPLSAPHTPLLPAPEFQGKSNAGIYGDFVMQTDHVVGQVLETLKRTGLDQNTLVIVTSDNGSTMTNHAPFAQYDHATNYHFRGQKSDAWDGGHRIPFIARWGKEIAPGTTCSELICLTDLLATCADLTGTDLAENEGEDSVSILPLLRGETGAVRDFVVHHSIDGKFALRQGDWKLVHCKGSGGWTQPDEKAPEDAPPAQLYHMGEDVGESRNRFTDNPQKVRELLALLDRVRNQSRSVPRFRAQNSLPEDAAE